MILVPAEVEKSIKNVVDQNDSIKNIWKPKLLKAGRESNERKCYFPCLNFNASPVRNFFII